MIVSVFAILFTVLFVSCVNSFGPKDPGGSGKKNAKTDPQTTNNASPPLMTQQRWVLFVIAAVTGSSGSSSSSSGGGCLWQQQLQWQPTLPAAIINDAGEMMMVAGKRRLQ